MWSLSYFLLLDGRFGEWIKLFLSKQFMWIFSYLVVGQDVESDDWQDCTVRPPRASQGRHRAGGRAAAGNTGPQVAWYMDINIYIVDTVYSADNDPGASTSCTRWPCKWSISSWTWRRVASVTTEAAQHKLEICLQFLSGQTYLV